MRRGRSETLYVPGASPLHRMPAQVKLVALLVLLCAVVLTPPQVAWAFAAHAGVVVLAAAGARLAPGVLGRRLLVEAPFVVFALAMPFVGGGERLPAGPLTLSVAGLWAAWGILAKSTIAVGASVVLTATTRVPDLLAGLGRLRVPALFTSIAGVTVRHLDVLVDEASRRRVAMASRGYRPRWAWQAGPMTASAGTLFVRSYERGERVYGAMVSRGYTGRMPDLGGPTASARDWVAALALPLVSVAVALIAVTGAGE
jgi:cobalt/nickel transport system permease protein